MTTPEYGVIPLIITAIGTTAFAVAIRAKRIKKQKRLSIPS